MDGAICKCYLHISLDPANVFMARHGPIHSGDAGCDVGSLRCISLSVDCQCYVTKYSCSFNKVVCGFTLYFI